MEQVKPRDLGLFDAMFFALRPYDFVRRLELNHTSWTRFTAAAIERLVSAFQGVTDLRFRCSIFDKPTDLWSVVARFPSLQRLSITFPLFPLKLPFSAPGLDVADILPHPRPPSIRDLVLSETSDGPARILEWFAFHGALVDSLSVYLGKFALPSPNCYLQVLGHSLLFFRIEVWYHLEATYFPQLDLSFNTHLRKLHLPKFRSRSCDTLSMIPLMLGKITSLRLYEIEFTCILEEQFLWELENDATSTTPGSSMWRALDDVLSGFNGLRITLSPDQSNPLSFVGNVRRGLSSCDARGLLSFEGVVDGHV